jgi:hypothetical protein
VSPPIFVTRVHIGKGPGIVLISLGTPAGELGRGPVENVEAVRVAMTFSTFKEVADLFSATVKDLQAGAAQEKGGRRTLRVSEDEGFGSDLAGMVMGTRKN